jgi:hypothetical protein
MNMNQMLQQTGAVDAISRQLGVDPATAEAGASALLPSILSGFQNPVAAGEAAPTSSAFPALGGGLGGLLGTIGHLGGADLLENVTSEEPTQVDKGNQILGHLFGSKDGSRAVAASAAAESGVQPSLLKKMLPILAMVAAGYVMKHAGQSGGLGGAFGGSASSGAAGTDAEPTASGSGDILGQIMGAAGKFLSR